MKTFQPNTIAKSFAAAAALFAGSSAFAIGPSYQYVLDPVPAAISTLNDVVDLQNPANTVAGTGTVIGATVIPIDGKTSDAVLNILTALHVAVGVNLVNFGAGPNAIDNAGANQSYLNVNNTATPNQSPLNPTFVTYTLASPNNPMNLPEDMAIMQANVYFTNAAKPAALTTILNNLASLDTAFNSAVGNQNVKFTEAGYGQGGVWNGTAAAAGTAYVGNTIYDARRFQNNNSTNLNANALNDYGRPNRFFQPIVNDAVLCRAYPVQRGLDSTRIPAAPGLQRAAPMAR